MDSPHIGVERRVGPHDDVAGRAAGSGGADRLGDHAGCVLAGTGVTRAQSPGGDDRRRQRCGHRRHEGVVAAQPDVVATDLGVIEPDALLLLAVDSPQHHRQERAARCSVFPELLVKQGVGHDVRTRRRPRPTPPGWPAGARHAAEPRHPPSAPRARPFGSAVWSAAAHVPVLGLPPDPRRPGSVVLPSPPRTTRGPKGATPPTEAWCRRPATRAAGEWFRTCGGCCVPSAAMAPGRPGSDPGHRHRTHVPGDPDRRHRSTPESRRCTLVRTSTGSVAGRPPMSSRDWTSVHRRRPRTTAPTSRPVASPMSASPAFDRGAAWIIVGCQRVHQDKTAADNASSAKASSRPGAAVRATAWA